MCGTWKENICIYISVNIKKTKLYFALLCNDWHQHPQSIIHILQVSSMEKFNVPSEEEWAVPPSLIYFQHISTSLGLDIPVQ